MELTRQQFLQVLPKYACGGKYYCLPQFGAQTKESLLEAFDGNVISVYFENNRLFVQVVAQAQEYINNKGKNAEKIDISAFEGWNKKYNSTWRDNDFSQQDKVEWAKQREEEAHNFEDFIASRS